MPDEKHLLQIVPHTPGSFDGVGDYALTLAKALFDDYGIRTTFLVAHGTRVENKEGFEIISGFSAEALHAATQPIDHVLLHYANYGYEARGRPVALRKFAQALRRNFRGRWITMFHELWASGPPWRSAFWTRPAQVKIARQIMDLSDSCFVSNQVIASEIRRCDPAKPIHQLPVMSNFGEPQLHDFSGRSPMRWAICGGAALIARSLRSFIAAIPSIPAAFRPERLHLIGGRREPGIDHLLQGLTSVSGTYHPEISAEAASEILTQCSFGWLDYFGRGKVWPGMIFKSGSFAAYCAHGIVPVFSHEEGDLEMDRDRFPGPFAVAGSTVRFPQPEKLPEISGEIYSWYQRHASSDRTAQEFAEALK